MKIYVVTEGSYSDYHIVGVSDDMETARKIAEYRGAEVETYDTNDFTDDRLFWLYTWRTWYDDYGEKQERESIECRMQDEFHEEVNIVRLTCGKRRYKVIVRLTWGKRRYKVVVKANDRDHALKTARDMVAQYKAKEAELT